MLSRSADAIYWMNRYIERAENIARLLDVNLKLMLDFPTGTEPWDALIEATGDRALFLRRFESVTPDKVLAFLTLDTENPNSIFTCVRAARENARSVRGIISSEMWEQVNRFYLLVHSHASAGIIMNSPHEFYTAVRMANHLYLGTTYDTMSFGEAWHFGRLGRLLERADKTSRMVDSVYLLSTSNATKSDIAPGEILWSAVLRSVGALEMYRQRYGRIVPISVADFLILDFEFPRSINSCVVRAKESLSIIEGSEQADNHSFAEGYLGYLAAGLSDVEIGDMAGRLPEFLDDFRTEINRIDDAIFEAFFILRPNS
jgi:uncharacterized alpha-E superfamily protein